MLSSLMRISIGLLLMHSFVWAQEDSLGTIALKEIEVIGQIPQAFLAGSKVQTINASFIEQYNSSNLADLLQNVSAIYIKSYGNGQLGSVAFRGTGASHTAVLWQGININSPTLGQSDFGTLPVFASSEVRLQFGAGSALYGSDAIGGSILLQESLPEKPFSVAAYSEIGSFGRFATGGEVAYQYKKLSGKTKLYYFQLENNFPYTDSRNQSQIQNNAEILNYGFLQQLNYSFKPHQILSINAWYANNERAIQPTEGNTTANERLFDQNLRIVADYQHKTTFGTFNLKTAYISDEQIFQSNGEGQVNAQKYVAALEYQHFLSKQLYFRSGFNWYYTQAQSDNLEANASENRPSLFFSLRYQTTPRLAFTINAQQTWVDAFQVPFTPSLGVEYVLLENQKHSLTLKGLGARSYRVPTFNDRFWQPGGKADLRPEYGWNAEVGLLYELSQKQFSLKSELTHYRLWINDWILWQPDGRGVWSPDNVRQVHGTGIEASLSGTYEQGKMKLELGGNYAFTQSLLKNEGIYQNKQLPYTPLHRLSLLSKANYHRYFVFANWQHTSLRYETLDNIQSIVTSIPAFSILNLGLGKEFTIQKRTLTAQVMVNNLMNLDYQNYLFRAMPGRNYQIRISFF